MARRTRPGADRLASGLIRHAKTVFESLAPGALAAGAAVDADDRLLYDHRTGALAYDADGSGAGAAVTFAVLDNRATLGAADILVV